MLINSNIYKKENQIWKLLDSIGKRDASNSIDIYSQLYNNNIPLIRILLNLLDLFKEMINQKLEIKEGKFSYKLAKIQELDSLPQSKRLL